ncbi:MAG: endonuclease III [Acidimicrobiales bacterium]
MGTTRAVRARTQVVRERLAGSYPGTAGELCALRHGDPFQLLVATILSAQCTDERVNQVTPTLFAEAPDALVLAGADPARVEELIRSTGFFRAKTQNLIAMARALVERFDGRVPTGMEELVALPGVGRKTANVVRSVAFGEPGLPVDTHVGRVSRRLRLTRADDPVKVEQDLDALVPPEERGVFSLRLILHGRAVCTARSPKCEACVLADVCPSAGVAAAPAKRRTPAAGRRTSASRSPGQRSPTANGLRTG